MKYTNEIEIDLPREKVVELFENPDNMKYWQPGLQSFEHISGTPGQPGAKSRLRYKMGKREIEMIETITKSSLPDEFNGLYETNGVYNVMNNRFIPVSENKTKWVSESEFQFSGFMKLMGWLMPGAFRKQSQKYLDDFKAFAEGKK
ncbi:MAG: SRPBCC family protein [Hymenobacteraceae bacterium]|nr:SRPBCC family protein [Hymenobacteraceae bacterium]MDX5396713.1 SRPBCC family protein [Hymenobacteraceae bacterium]MDX5443561.1 SRPBCC family protein [Hymenobacteraceae bacterium]MDX5512773.1 SRPBCC family protein [Hymenobacteraceae bacterium]